MKSYDFYLFDADGTLFDTVDLICTCFTYIAQKYTGESPPRDTIIAGIGAPLKDQVIQHLGSHLNLDEVLKDYLNFQLSIMKDSVTLFPGVSETLETLKTAGKKLAIVTSRRRYSLEVILSSTNTAHFFDLLVTPEDTARHKPDPEPALKAMSLLGAERASTVFTGDALFDICSGADAGIDTVFVNWSRSTVESLPVSPTWTIDRMQDLTKNITQSI